MLNFSELIWTEQPQALLSDYQQEILWVSFSLLKKQKYGTSFYILVLGLEVWQGHCIRDVPSLPLSKVWKLNN